MNKLRRGECWRSSDIQIFQEESTPLEGVAGPSLDIIFTLERWVFKVSRGSLFAS